MSNREKIDMTKKLPNGHNLGGSTKQKRRQERKQEKKQEREQEKKQESN